MALRLYRKFYRVNHAPSTETYSLIDPFSVGANSYDDTNSTFVENLTVTRESQGVYYIDISTSLYNSIDIYDLRWNIIYTNGTSNKILHTFFQYSGVNAYSIYKFGEIDFELGEAETMQYEVERQESNSYEIQESNAIDYDFSESKIIEFDVSQQEITIEIKNN